ncbi:MAG: hypothetical protein ABI912_06935 [Actinomycetota bacterium]
MRMLVLEAHPGESDDVLLEAADRGHEVFRCQPVDGQVLPCNGLVGESGCPFDDRIDVAIDVHLGTRGLTPRELGLLCAEQSGIPIVVAGKSPIGESAPETTLADVVIAAERLFMAADMRLPLYALERSVRGELANLGRRTAPVWVSYEDHDGVFDVVVEGDGIGPVEQAALDAALLPMFAEAMVQRRFGDTVYRRHTAESRRRAVLR